MSDERKKADKKPVPKLEPKKRVAPIPVPKVEPKKRAEVKLIAKEIPKPIILEPTEKVKRSENKYVRISLDAKQEERKEFSEKMQRGELKLAYYAIDGDKSYHYYLVMKK
jgi:hypothetical protein